MTEPRPFTHRDGGTDEPTWLLDERWDGVPRLALQNILLRCPRVVLIAPHPDDESLSLGATLADLAGNGADVTVVVTTHGGSGPGSTVRRTEGDRALLSLSPRIKALWWDLPDGGLKAAEDELRDRIADLTDARTLLLVPVECDGHADHESVTRAAEAVARDKSATLLGYPVWLWHWAKPSDLNWARLRVLAPSLSGLRAKRAAIGCHTSQLTSEDGSPIVGSSVLGRAGRLLESVFIPLAPDLAARVENEITERRPREEIAEPFDAMLDSDGDDPWRLDDSPYEIRRLAIVLAVLGRQRYGRVLEVGCATGQLSERIRDHADEVIGMDASERALDIARARTARVRWLLGAAPQDMPAVDVDLVVLSEVGYFLDGPDLLATLRHARQHLRPGGEIVIANWRGPCRDIPLDADAVHDQAASILDLPRRAHYLDADLIVEVWGEPVSVYRQSHGEDGPGSRSAGPSPEDI